VDAAVHEHATVQPFYDSMVAKLIVTAKDRTAAIQRLQWAMDEFVVEGIRTTLPMQRQLVSDPMFAAVDYHTKTVDSWVTTRQK
jgi:acetyl-CoA carboxylase biotin carboxylase subunit